MLRRWFILTIVLLLVSGASGAGLQRVKYNHPGLVVDLGVGLWGWPLPMDYDGDGDLDLLVSCSDVPYNGLYLFENPGGDAAGGAAAGGAKMPVFKPAVRIARGLKNVAISYPDGRPRIMLPGQEIIDAVGGAFNQRRKVYPASNIYPDPLGRVRANQWNYVDYDGDGALDLVVGVGVWRDYGWDDAFNDHGQWTRGPLHGYVFVIANTAATDKPAYAQPVQLTAGGKPVDVFGMPSPNFADFDGDGDLDLICGDFVGGFTYFQNTGTRRRPVYAAGRTPRCNGKPLAMHLCMSVVVAIDWDRDGDVDLVAGQEDGRVAFIEHTGQVVAGLPVFAEPRFFQQQADDVKFGALVTPVSFDWDGDGDEDIIAGDTAGEIGFIENLDGGDPPRWAAPKLLEADGRPIRIMAGLNGSIQGPAERKWGYTTLSVADWDGDGLVDVVVNSIWGKVQWHRNVGTRTAPKLAAAQPITVRWPGKPPSPAWNWWQPEHNELATQWRTTPVVVDFDGDGLNDLVMLDHEGYLAWFPRQRVDGRLVLLPGRRVFRGGTFNNSGAGKVDPAAVLRLNDGVAGKSGRRKLCVVDFDGDGKRDLLVNSVNVNFLRNVSAAGPPWTLMDMGKLDDRRLAGHTTSPTTVDWNGDGVRDLLVGAEDGHLYYMPNPRKR